MKAFKIRVPATVSNIGPGYDVLGFAIDLYLVVEVMPGSGNFFLKGCAKGISNDNNALAEAYRAEADKEGNGYAPVDITVDSNIPLKMGLGSSAAARVGGIMAAAQLSKEDERKDRFYVASHAALYEGHPDNAVPAAVGGLTVSALTDNGELYYNRHEIKTDLKIVLGIPDMEISTNEARAALPENIRFSDAVYSNSRSCLLLSALISGRKELLREAVKDMLHQPYRKKLIPGFDEIVERTYECGALATAISGSGPAVISFSEEKDTDRVGRAMAGVWKEHGINSEYLVKSIVDRGAEIYD